MPSGVSHGSALPGISTPAVFSKAILAKFGMRLMGPILAQAVVSGRCSIMIRMLVVDDSTHLLRPVILQCGLAWHIGDPHHPAEPGFGAILPGRNQPVRPVEGAGHDLDPRIVDAAEAQGRATVGAVVALRDGGGAERRRLAAGPGEILLFDVGEGGKRCARRLLAHPAMADADLDRRGLERKANGTALAAASQNRFGLRRHARS